MTIKDTLEHYLTWFKAHERLVLLLAIGFFAVHFYGKVLDYLIKHDQTQAQISTQQAQIAAAKVTQDDQQNKLLAQQLDSLRTQIAEQTKRIDLGMQQRAANTAAQKHADDVADASGIANRIRQLVGVGNIRVEPSVASLPDTLQFDLPAAHAVADNLEDLQQAKGDVIDLNTKLVSCKTVTDKQTDVIVGLNTQITDSAVALQKEQKSHTDDVSVLKAEKRKSWINGFKWGAIAGFVGGLFVPKVH